MDLEAVRARAASAAERSGRDARDVTIVAVTKGHPTAAVLEAVTHGLTDIGENKVQEALAKQEALADKKVTWHLIGHLQRNKAKQAFGKFALIQSVDSIRLVDALEKAAGDGDAIQDVLIEVNVAREPQKSGVLAENLESLVLHAWSQHHLRVQGLMTIAPFTEDEDAVRRVFRRLRQLRDQLQASDFQLPILSMGMSNDFEIAIEEGATMVRLGTVLFGERSA